MKQEDKLDFYETERVPFYSLNTDTRFQVNTNPQFYNAGEKLGPTGPTEHQVDPDMRAIDNKIYVENSGPSLGKNENPIKISFRNLTYEAMVSKKDATGAAMREGLKILKGVSGVALPGEAIYVMGSSGSGKTSLLNILSDRINTRRGVTLGGEVFINDTIPLTLQTFGKFGAYVMQDDILFAQFTPLQAIRFAARLKLKVPVGEQEERIKALISDLGLEESQNTMIGSPEKKGISGGQRKRTSIAVEMVTNPSILFLDEPTSGLDSFNALIIVKMLDRLAKQGKTIMTTIHQPSSDAFKLFGKLILMVEGNIVYQGYAKDSPDYFSEIGAPVGLYKNPADHFMKILSLSYNPEEKGISAQKVEYLVSQYHKRQTHSVQQLDENYTFPPPDFEIHARQSASYCSQIKQLMIRNKAWIAREPKVLKVKLLQAGVLALAGLAVFWNLELHDFQDLMNMAGCMSFVCIASFMQLLAGTILVFQAERPVFVREQANQMYSIGAYYQTKVIAEMPIVILTPIIFSSILYFGIGLTISASQYFIFLLTIFLLMVCSMAMGYFLSSLFDNAETAATTYTVFAMPLILFGGLLANSETIPVWISWFQYVSPVRYAFEAMMWNEFDGRVISETIIDPMQLLGFDLGLWKCLYILIGFTVFYRFMAMLMLKLLIKRFQ